MSLPIDDMQHWSLKQAMYALLDTSFSSAAHTLMHASAVIADQNIVSQETGHKGGRNDIRGESNLLPAHVCIALHHAGW